MNNLKAAFRFNEFKFVFTDFNDSRLEQGLVIRDLNATTLQRLINSPDVDKLNLLKDLEKFEITDEVLQSLIKTLRIQINDEPLDMVELSTNIAVALPEDIPYAKCEELCNRIETTILDEYNRGVLSCYNINKRIIELVGKEGLYDTEKGK